MRVGRLFVVAGATGAFVVWITWTSPGRASELFAKTVVHNFSPLGLVLGPIPGSHAGLATGQGKVGAVLGVLLVAGAIACRFLSDRRGLLILCACGLVAGSIGLVVDAYSAVRETVDATSDIDRGFRQLVRDTAGLPTLPVVGSISDDIARQVHDARRHVVQHSVRPALLGLAAGAVALVGSLVLLAGATRQWLARSEQT